jgi:pSer/pThr/pTyr-binding forkhead associated (FHA) protein
MRTRITYVLRAGARQFRLQKESIIVGRGSAADIQVNSGLVSRQHARLTLTNLGVLVEDMGSRNGVFVNSQRVDGSLRMKSGDSLTIGDETLVLNEIEEALEEPRSNVTLVGARAELDSFTDDDVSLATRSADIFQLLAGVVDKALALGRGEEAEHIIGTHLRTALNDAQQGKRVSPDIARSAAGYALKLAGATGKAAWFDYTIALYSALRLVLPLGLVDDMYALLKRVRSVDLIALREYTVVLKERQDSLTAAERFVLQRIVGLERLALWQHSNTY